MKAFKVAFFGRKRIPESRASEYKMIDVLCQTIREHERVEIYLGSGSFFDDVCCLAVATATEKAGVEGVTIQTARTYPLKKRFLSLAKRADLVFAFALPDEDAAEAVRLAEDFGKAVIYL